MPKARCLTGRVFLDEIERRNWRPQAIGGLTMGADPIVVSVAMLSAQQAHLRSTDVAAPAAQEWIHGFLVRKSEKAHGTGQRIEGFREKGARVVIVDDVCTTGASTVQAIEAASEFGFRDCGRDVPGGARRGARAAPPWKAPLAECLSFPSSLLPRCARSTFAISPERDAAQCGIAFARSRRNTMNQRPHSNVAARES